VARGVASCAVIRAWQLEGEARRQQRCPLSLITTTAFALLAKKLFGKLLRAILFSCGVVDAGTFVECKRRCGGRNTVNAGLEISDCEWNNQLPITTIKGFAENFIM
jgi:hypothetical protein